MNDSSKWKARLSEKERKVLKLIMQGKNTSEIASDMAITERTVKFHISNIMEKLHAKNRAHAATIAIERKLLS